MATPTHQQPAAASHTSSSSAQRSVPYNTRLQASRPQPVASPSSLLLAPGPSTRRSTVSYRDAHLGKERMAAQETANKEDRALFLQFLRTFTKPGNRSPFYKAEALAMHTRGDFHLQVNFYHMLSLQYLKLAMRIGNDADSSHTWLKPAAADFLAEEGFNAEISSRALIAFAEKPDGIQTLKDFLEANKDKIKHGVKILSEDVIPASALGRALYGSLVCHVLGKHERDVSWNGGFTSEDILVLWSAGSSVRCFVLREASLVPAPGSSKANDLHAISAIMQPYYDKVLFFDILDLDLKTVTAEVARSRWFAEYLRYHVALMPSASRRSLVNLLHSVSTLLPRYHHGDYSQVGLTLDSRPPDIPNWMFNIGGSGKAILLGVYNHDVAARVLQSLPPDVVAQAMLRKRPQPRFHNTYRSILDYHRNALEHLHEHIELDSNRNPLQKVMELDEIELYAAKTIPPYLPKLLKNLLRQGNGVPAKPFQSAWSNFKASQRDGYDMYRSL